MFCLSLGSCKLRIHFSFFALLAFLNLFAGMENGGLTLLSILLHECAHLTAMILCGAFPSGISVSAFGMEIIVPEKAVLTYRQNVAISLSGPLLNFMLALAADLFAAKAFAGINLVLGCTHILPIEPLDGGLALKSLLTEKLGADKAGKFCFVLSLLILFPVAVLGFMLLIYSKNNFSLLLLALYLIFYLLFKRDDGPVKAL